VTTLPPLLVVGVLGIGWAVCAGAAGAHRLRRTELRRSIDQDRSGRSGWSPRVRSRTAPRAQGGPIGPIGPIGDARRSVDRAVVALGTAVRRPAPALERAPGTAAVTADDAGTARRTGWTVLLGLVLALGAPALGAIPLVWAVAGPVVAARRRLARREAQVHDQLPDVVDLLALTTAAGLPVSAALVALGGRPGGPIGDVLADAAAHVRHGGTTARALAGLAAAGPPVRPLVEALAQHDHYGTPLLPALERVGIEARARRRRRAEAAARRLPVTLLLPLVLTTFPAFVLLTVVPLLAGSLGSLSLTPP
jgi:hypothetical protein